MKVQTDPMMRIDIFSHFFKVTKITPRILSLLFKFSAKFTEPSQMRGPKAPEPKVFATKTKNNLEFRFHVGQLNEFKQMLQYEFIEPYMYDVIRHDLYRPEKIKLSMRDGWILKDYQEEAKTFILDEEEDSDDKTYSRLATLPTGTGKEAPFDSLIKIPGGWSTMGAMALGTAVTAPDGTTTHVTGIYPQGTKPVFKITFKDGRSAECGLEHLWKVYNENWNHSKHGKWRVINTRELIRLKSLKGNRLYVPLTQSEIIPGIELPIDPYLLGVLLGDGCLVGGSVNICKPSGHIYQRVEKIVGETQTPRWVDDNRFIIAGVGKYYTGRNSLLTKLRELGLQGKRSFEKTIPDVYLHGSTEQRLQLLQGLMDTDGTIDKGNCASFCSTSLNLAQGVQYLIRSLGGMAKIAIRRPHYTHKGEKKRGRDAYQVNIRYQRPEELFSIPHKLERADNNHQYSKGMKLRIEKIEFIGNKECQCISVAHPDHLYITDDFIVTHNTVTAMASALSMSKRILVAVLPRYSEKWLSDVCEIADVKPKEVMNIAGGDSLRGLISMAQDGQPLSKIIVVSLTTLQNFYKDYEEHPDACRDKYGCIPEELHQLLSIGSVIIDEAHEHLHAFFKMMLYTHCPKLIALSGTYLSDNPFIDGIQKLVFPKELRYDKIKMEQYIKVYPISYSFKNFQQSKIKTTEFNSNNYSQVAYEKSIMKNPVLLKNYLGMIDHLVDFGYNRPYMEGDKLAIYAGSVSMCGKITDYLKEKYPDKDVRRYVEKDPYENVIKPDIRVTTIISAGTAIDIPGLRTVIMTPNVNSPVANLQTLGRLRKMKDRDVKFFYTWCQDIKKHADYHYRRMDLFKDRVALIKEFKSPVLI